jgi:Co/Zn/Cd efflux system component
VSVHYWIWAITLVIITFVVVPVALYWLHRLLKAAKSIELYTREMLEAGVGIANNTAAVPALENTLKTAGSLVEASILLKGGADAVGSLAVDLAANK